MTMMNIMEEKPTKPLPVKADVLRQLIPAIPLGLILFLIVSAILVYASLARYKDRILPGVNIGGVDVSELTREEAYNRLLTELPYTTEGSILLTYNDQSWLVKPIELGFMLDPISSVDIAMQYGRGKFFLLDWLDQLFAERNGVSFAPVVFYDQRTAFNYLQNLANTIDNSVMEANLGLQGTEVIIRSGQVGRELDITATLQLVHVPLTMLQDAVVPLVVKETPPMILDVSEQAEIAKSILSQPFVMALPQNSTPTAGPWQFEPTELANLLTFVPKTDAANAQYEIALNRDMLRQYLDSLSPSLKVEPVNPRFVFNDETQLLELIEPAVIGRELNIEASIDAIAATALTGKHTVELVFDENKPAVTDDMTGEELGITELFHEEEISYFYGSAASRVQNIATAAARFHGLLIPPHTTFSMGDALGDVTLDAGYTEALIIYGNSTITGVGGGVCQVSTTLFRAAFFAGFPIEERYAHAYRVSYYEMVRDGSTNPQFAGLDATVYTPLVDFKFTNDTDNWLLMETYVGNYYSLTWKFYSTKDGRTVDWNTTGPTNRVPPPDPLYKENPALPKGEIKKVDYAAEGADVMVNRTVYRDGAVLFSDQFFTHYQAWRAVYEYGPGTEGIPTPKPTEQ